MQTQHQQERKSGQEHQYETDNNSVRSGRRIEKGEWANNSVRHWRTRKDPLETVWDSMLVPLLKERPALTPTTLLEILQDKYLGQYPNSLRRTMQRRAREWKLQYGAEQEVMFRQRHQPGLRGLSDFTELKGVVVTIAGKLLAHKLYHFRLEWSHWSWMRVVLGGESFSALAEGLQEALGQLKRRICQALILRGSNDFSTIEEYQTFITQQVMRHNVTIMIWSRKNVFI